MCIRDRGADSALPAAPPHTGIGDRSPIGKTTPSDLHSRITERRSAAGPTSRTRPQLSYRLPEPLVHQDGGTEGVQRILEKCEVVGAPEQRTPLHHHSLDHRTS